MLTWLFQTCHHLAAAPGHCSMSKQTVTDLAGCYVLALMQNDGRFVRARWAGNGPHLSEHAHLDGFSVAGNLECLPAPGS